MYGAENIVTEIPVGSYAHNNLIEMITETIFQQYDESVITMKPNIQIAKITMSTNRKINELGSVFGFQNKWSVFLRRINSSFKNYQHLT